MRNTRYAQDSIAINASYARSLVSNMTQNKSSMALSLVDRLHSTLLLTDEIGKWVQLVSIVLAFLGNLLILLSSRAKKLPLYRILIRNLAYADLVYATLQILRIHARFNNNRWIFGDLMCRVSVFSNIAIANAMLMVTFIALERYRSLIHPLKPKLRRSVASRITISLWIFAFLIDLPIMIYSRVNNELGYTECHADFPTQSIASYSIGTFIAIFGFPFLITSACYILIGVHFFQKNSSTSNDTSEDQNSDLTRSKRKTESQKKMVLMLSLVVTALVITTLPNHVYSLWQTLAPKKNLSSRKTFIVLYGLCHLVHTHAWTNCLIYSIMDSKFRKNIYQSLCRGRRLMRGAWLPQNEKSNDFEVALRLVVPTRTMSKILIRSSYDMTNEAIQDGLTQHTHFSQDDISIQL